MKSNSSKKDNECTDCSKPIQRRSTRCASCATKKTGYRRTGREHHAYGDNTWLSNGYVMIRNEETRVHPNARKDGAIQGHRLVMSNMLGRPLLEGENVHHKNGVKNDNRPENLELWVVNQPFGQRPEDLVAWAKEILIRYDTN